MDSCSPVASSLVLPPQLLFILEKKMSHVHVSCAVPSFFLSFAPARVLPPHVLFLVFHYWIRPYSSESTPSRLIWEVKH